MARRRVRQPVSRKTEIVGAVFGPIRGIAVGAQWETRKEMAASCIHPPLIAGIYGRKATGAFSVVLAGEFPDEDYGDHFTYIGSGGRESGVRFGPQTCDQSFANGRNEALRMSARRKTPVRVIRGYKLNSKYAPHAGYRYDGLYTVSNPRIERAPNGFNICKFDFTRCTSQAPMLALPTYPDGHRSDMQIRREEWKRSNAASGKSESPISISDDDEDQEDIFGDLDDVEAAMDPVSGYLDELNGEDKKHRKNYLLAVGQHVNKVLKRKERLGKDEAGRDRAWWYDALWSYVARSMPGDEVPAPGTVEIWYQNAEDKAQQKIKSCGSPA